MKDIHRSLTMAILLLLAAGQHAAAQLFTKQYALAGQNMTNNSSTLLSDDNMLSVGTISALTLEKKLFACKISTATGDTLWSKTYALDGKYLSGISCDELDNGTIVIGANATNAGVFNSPEYSVLLGISTTGNVLWSKMYSYTGSYPYTEINKIKKLPGNNFIACLCSADSLGLSVIKMDAAGDTLFSKAIRLDSTISLSAARITDVLAVDNGYLFAGEVGYSSLVTSFMLIKTDTMGNVVWIKSDFLNFSTLYLDPDYCRLQLAADSSVLVGINGFSTQILKLTTVGVPVWLKNYTDTPTIAAMLLQDMVPAGDGNYLLCGITDYHSTVDDWHMTGKQYIAKVTPAGSVIWAKKYKGHKNLNLPVCIAPLPGNSIFVGGTSYDSVNYSPTMHSQEYAMHLDTGGVSAGLACAFDITKNVQVSDQPIFLFNKHFHAFNGYGFNNVSVTTTDIAPLASDQGLMTTVGIIASPGFICAGTSVTVTAQSVNGGTSPTYTFMVNGVIVQSGPAHTYISTTLADGDTVTCTVESSDPCVSPATATSNAIIMRIWPTADPAVTITASPGTTVASGTTVTFTASVVNGGPAPYYDWRRSGVNTGTNSPTYSSSSLADGDVINCLVTSSACAAHPQDTSNTDVMTITSAGVFNTYLPATALRPNPANTMVTIDVPFTCAGRLVITDITGRIVADQPVSGGSHTINTAHLDNGLYFLRLEGYGSTYLAKLMIAH